MSRPFWSFTIVILIVLTGFAAPPVWAQSALFDVLPTAAEVSGGLIVSDEGERTLAEQATTFTDPIQTERLLAGWGWQQNAYRFFRAQYVPEIYVEISITQFASADDATAAMAYFVDDRKQSTNAEDRPIGPIVGDEVRQLISPAAGGTDLTLYVRSGSLVMRLSELLQEGDPIAHLDKVADDILNRVAVAGI